MLVAWMGDNCSHCHRVGDDMWIDVECEVARRIVWGGEPYNAEDTELILSRINQGSCATFEDKIEKQNVQKAGAKAILKKHDEARLRVRQARLGIPEKAPSECGNTDSA